MNQNIDSLLFDEKIKLIIVPNETKPRYFNLCCDWICSSPIENKKYFVGLYCHRRDKSKNYSSYCDLSSDIQQYQFPIDLPEGYYDVRVCKNIGYFNYEVIYNLPKIHLTNDTSFCLTATYDKEDNSIQLYWNRPSEEGDYIGIFLTETNSMREQNMVGQKKYLLPKSSLCFKLTNEHLIKGNIYEIRYFKYNCCIESINYLYKWDYAYIPFAFSNSFCV